MTVLAIGDVVGEPGLWMCERHLRSLIRLYHADVCVVNGENAAIYGITPSLARRIFDAGADVVTLGNHAFQKREIASELDDNSRLLRPLNFAPQTPGGGYCVVETKDGLRCCVISLIGQCFMGTRPAESPFSVLNSFLRKHAGKADVYVVDMHAEATSEKLALAYHMCSRVQVVFGTHTHVPTADAGLIDGRLGYITDVGMTGAARSILGVDVEQSVSNFLGNMPQRLRPAPGPKVMQGAVFVIEEGVAVHAQRVEIAD